VTDEPVSWQKLPAVEGSVACFTCGAGARSDLDPERMICVGFGTAGYSKDGLDIWTEGGADDEEPPLVRDVERVAALDPNHDWRIYFEVPLYSAEYQRQGDGIWVLIRKGEGFA
jgi:hypothetical protein